MTTALVNPLTECQEAEAIRLAYVLVMEASNCPQITVEGLMLSISVQKYLCDRYNELLGLKGWTPQ